MLFWGGKFRLTTTLFRLINVEYPDLFYTVADPKCQRPFRPAHCAKASHVLARLYEYRGRAIALAPAAAFAAALALADGKDFTLKFLCDGQVADRRAIMYADRFFYYYYYFIFFLFSDFLLLLHCCFTSTVNI